MATEQGDPLLAKARWTVYITRELRARLDAQAQATNRSANNLLCLILDEALPPLVGEDRREVLRRADAAGIPPPVATVPVACPACGDDVFFRTLPNGVWKCDACNRSGSY